MRWGSWGAQMSTQQYADIITKWLECGVNEFDLANLYGDYSCEKEFGEALRRLKISRPSVRLISKMGIENPSVERGNSVKHYNYSKKHIVSSVEQTLQDLQTDYLDVLLLHRPSPLMQTDEVAEAILSMTSEGKINSFGVSNFLPAQVEWLSKQIKIEHNQIAFALSNVQAMENGDLESFASQKLTVTAYSPIIHLENTSAELKFQLTSLSEKYNCSEACIAVAWVLKHPMVASCVIGTSRIDRILEVRRALDLDFELQDYFKLWEAARGTRVP